MGFSMGLSLGAGLGVFLGILSHNPAVFVTIGSITGISIGVTVSHSIIKPGRIDE
jgi:hypothetical protein